MLNTVLTIRTAMTVALSLALAGPLCAQTQSVNEKPDSGVSKTVAACERAVQELLATKGAPTAEVKFIGTPTTQPRLSSDSQVALQGAGSWRASSGVNNFAYTCNADLETSEVVGIVMRDTTPASAKATPARITLEPDLTNLSPTACESSVAAILRKRWPRVSEINFDSATRQLNQASPNMTELRGRGRALPAPGAPLSHFGFDCEIDTRDGRVLNTQVSK